MPLCFVKESYSSISTHFFSLLTPLSLHTQALFYSVISYAVFEVGYKKWGSEEGDPASVANSLRFLGYLGINTLAWLWPGFLILHYSGVEPFEWPPYGKTSSVTDISGRVFSGGGTGTEGL